MADDVGWLTRFCHGYIEGVRLLLIGESRIRRVATMEHSPACRKKDIQSWQIGSYDSVGKIHECPFIEGDIGPCSTDQTSLLESLTSWEVEHGA